jgi:hypothetical protein
VVPLLSTHLWCCYCRHTGTDGGAAVDTLVLLVSLSTLCRCWCCCGQTPTAGAATVDTLLLLLLLSTHWYCWRCCCRDTGTAGVAVDTLVLLVLLSTHCRCWCCCRHTGTAGECCERCESDGESKWELVQAGAKMGRPELHRMWHQKKAAQELRSVAGLNSELFGVFECGELE